MFIIIKNTKVLAKRDKSFRKLYRKYRSFIETYEVTTTSAQFKPEKIIWVLWLQGLNNAPPLVKACVNSLQQVNKDYKVVILTEQNLFNYISLPQHIMKKYSKKMISKTQFSDIVRVTLLCRYGGIWADATVLCTDNKLIKEISDLPLFVFKILDLERKDEDSVVASSWFISSFSKSSILLLTRDLLYKYWEDHILLTDYFTFHLFLTMATRKYQEEWKAVPMYNNRTPHTLMFELGDKYNEHRWNIIKSFSSIHKLTHHIKYPTEESNFYNKIIQEYN